MLRFSCDKCGKMLEVSDDLAGKKVECPSCHDVNSVPTVLVSDAPLGSAGHTGSSGPRSPQASLDRASAAGFPPDTGPEKEVLRVRPAFARGRPFRFAALVIAALAGISGAIYWGLVSSQREYAIAAGVVAALALFALGLWRLLHLGDVLIITNKRSIERRGLLSKRTSEVVHDNIRNFQMTQTVWDRVLNVGHIGISSSGQDGIEIVMEKVPRPNQVKKIIDLYRPM
jgi:phage FluMu protein Com